MTKKRNCLQNNCAVILNQRYYIPRSYRVFHSKILGLRFGSHVQFFITPISRYHLTQRIKLAGIGVYLKIWQPFVSKRNRFISIADVSKCDKICIQIASDILSYVNIASSWVIYFKMLKLFKLRHYELMKDVDFFSFVQILLCLLVFSMVPNICYFCFLRTARCYFEVEKVWVKDFAINRIMYIDSNNDNELLMKSSICVIQPLNKCWYRFIFLAL